MPTKPIIELEPKREHRVNSKVIAILAAVIVAAFIVLLLVGFENALSLLRYRVTLFFLLGPLVALFLWCAWKAFGPRDRK